MAATLTCILSLMVIIIPITEGWNHAHRPTKTTTRTSRVVLSFVPVSAEKAAEDMFRIVPTVDDPTEEHAVIHKDTDDDDNKMMIESHLNEAHAELEAMLLGGGGGQQQHQQQKIRQTATTTTTGFGGLFHSSSEIAGSSLSPRRGMMRTPRENHFLMTALDSWKKIPRQQTEMKQQQQQQQWDTTWHLLGA